MTGSSSSSSSSSPTRAYVLLAVVMLLWAGNSIVGRAVRDDVLPFTFAFGRWVIASLVVLPFGVAKLRQEWRAALGGWQWILVLGFFGIVCFNSFTYSGLRHTTATNALLLQASIPGCVLVLERVLHGARATAMQVIGVIVSTLGVVVVVARGDLAVLGALHFGNGDLLVLVAVVVWALYTVFLRKRPDISAMGFLLLIFGLGAVFMAPLAAMEIAQGEAVRWSWPIIAAFAYVGVFPSAVAYIIYNAATLKLGAARAGQAITLMPLFGALLSALLLGEQLHGYHFAGMALILAGIVVTMLAARRSLPGTDQEAQNTGGASHDAGLEHAP